MKVFLSWHGQISHSIALALHDWLPQIIQNIEPWVSSEDIAKGSRWSPAIAKELSDSRAAIFCMTADNIEAPWLNFEAGAVSNTPWVANVCTYLFGITNASVTGPLTQFQSTIANDRVDNLKLLTTINNAQESPLKPKLLEKAFDTYWPELELSLKGIGLAKQPVPIKRSPQDIAEETLNIVREIQKSTYNQLELAEKIAMERNKIESLLQQRYFLSDVQSPNDPRQAGHIVVRDSNFGRLLSLRKPLQDPNDSDTNQHSKASRVTSSKPPKPSDPKDK